MRAHCSCSRGCWRCEGACRRAVPTPHKSNNLAGLLRDQGDLAGARPLFERALAIREKVLGPEHPHTIRARDNLAKLRHAESAQQLRIEHAGAP